MDKLYLQAIPLAIGFITLVGTNITSRIDWHKNNIRFNIKKVIDCLFYSVMFIFASATNYIFTELELSIADVIFSILMCVGVSIYGLYLFTKQFIFFSNPPFKLNQHVFPMILISLLVGVLMSLSTINYAIYVIWPSFYEIPCGLSFGEIAFEFIYYTFTLALTYSGSSITVAHVATKVVQMIEICYCYAIIGGVIIQLIDQLKNREVTIAKRGDPTRPTSPPTKPNNLKASPPPRSRRS